MLLSSCLALPTLCLVREKVCLHVPAQKTTSPVEIYEFKHFHLVKGLKNVHIRVRSVSLLVDCRQVSTLLDCNLKRTCLVVVVKAEQYFSGYSYIPVVAFTGITVVTSYTFFTGLKWNNNTIENITIKFQKMMQEDLF